MSLVFVGKEMRGIYGSLSALRGYAIEHGGVVRSFDRGQTWEDVGDGFEYPDIHMVARSPGSKTKYFAATSRGFFLGMARRSIGTQPGGVHGRKYRSEDGGQSWRQIGAGLPAKHAAMCWQLAFNPYHQNAIFAAFGDVARGHTAGPPGQGAIYVTYDRGDTWEEVALQKRGTKWLQPPAIRVLWAAAEE